MPRVPYTGDSTGNVRPMLNIDPTTYAMAAGMLYSEGKLFERPTFGLEPGGTLDRSIGEGMIKDRSRFKDDTDQYKERRKDMDKAQEIEDAVMGTGK
jgi:hypothetical protein